jgi:hypothetical protein
MAFVEMMTPAIAGTLFNSERRQTPFLIELEGLVMRALLTLPRNEASLARKNLLATWKVPDTPFVASGRNLADIRVPLRDVRLLFKSGHGERQQVPLAIGTALPLGDSKG